MNAPALPGTLASILAPGLICYTHGQRDEHQHIPGGLIVAINDDTVTCVDMPGNDPADYALGLHISRVPIADIDPTKVMLHTGQPRLYARRVFRAIARRHAPAKRRRTPIDHVTRQWVELLADLSRIT